MALQAKKLHFIQEILSINNERVIDKLGYLLKKAQQRISIEEYNRELEQADAEIDRGEFYTQEEVEKMSREW